VHWTSASGEQSIFNQGRINASENSLLWFEKADSIGQLKSILAKGGANTGAKSNEVAVIVDLTGLQVRSVGGGGVNFSMPQGMQLTGSSGRGITWYRNTGVQQHINRIGNYVRDGKRTY
jgi:hypothetical protein